MTSISEKHGIAATPENALRVYSVGVSTAGEAEIRMAKANPKRHIIATTIDKAGLAETKKIIQDQGLSEQIEVKLEDVATPLPYSDGTFDYIYARLVLHYLTKQELQTAVSELHRTLKIGGKLFVVVRSTHNIDFTTNATNFDETTGITTFVSRPNKDVTEVRKRHFHTEESISTYLEEAGFHIEASLVYDEKLFHDYHRKVTVDHTDNLIELLAVK